MTAPVPGWRSIVVVEAAGTVAVDIVAAGGRDYKASAQSQSHSSSSVAVAAGTGCSGWGERETCSSMAVDTEGEAKDHWQTFVVGPGPPTLRSEVAAAAAEVGSAATAASACWASAVSPQPAEVQVAMLTVTVGEERRSTDATGLQEPASRVAWFAGEVILT